jgi:uncharacterized protein YjdB
MYQFSSNVQGVRVTLYTKTENKETYNYYYIGKEYSYEKKKLLNKGDKYYLIVEFISTEKTGIISLSAQYDAITPMQNATLSQKNTGTTKYFCYIPEHTGPYTFSNTGDKTYMQINDSNMEFLSNNYIEGSPKELIISVEAGKKYYIVVDSEDTEYTISVEEGGWYLSCDKTDYVIKAGETAELSVKIVGTVDKSKLQYEWRELVSQTKITNANSNIYTATKPGTYSVTVSDGNIKHWAAFRVLQDGDTNISTSGITQPDSSNIILNATKFAMKVKQSTTKLTVSGLAAGDSIASWTSSNPKVATVNSKGKITAKKVGKATITVKLASGQTASATVTVQKGAVKTTKISGLSKTLTLKKGAKSTLKPVVTPITSQDKLTYSTSNQKVATVSKSGVITAKKAGKAKITVTSGKKKFTVTVTVK